MRSTRKIWIAGLVTVALTGAMSGCSGTATKESVSSVASSVASSASATPSAAPAAAHNQADVMFAHHMIAHHQQAIEMSDMILGKQGIDPRVVELATQIKAAQGPEVEQMQGWLNQWGAPTMPGMSGMPGMPGSGGMQPSEPRGTESPSSTTAPSGSMMPGMPGMGGMPGMDDMGGMGMMSDSDMDALKNADGVQASKLFLTQMIQHHQGAITMAQNEIKNGQNPDAIALANSISTSQQKEIDTMNQILASL